MRHWLGQALLAAALAVPMSAMGQSDKPMLAAQVRSAVVNALQGQPGAPFKREDAAAVQLLDVSIDDTRVTLDFSTELLDLEPGSALFEQFMRRVHVAATDVLRHDLETIEYRTHIDGVPLGAFLAVIEPAPPAESTPRRSAPWAKSVSSRRIAVSPGHGYYFDATWKLQRSYFFGIVEDFINFDIVQLLRDRLAADGAWVRPTRNMDKAAGNGESGNPRWQEAARYHIKSLGVPATVWDSSTTDLNDDIRSRPLYANWVDGNGMNAEILVSLHNNGGGGTGTETLYDSANGFQIESKRLADAVHGRILTAIRSQYNPSWADRRVQGFAGDYGENRLATRPSVLIELAFMDRQSPDNAALQDPRFRELVVEAIKQGVADFFGTLQTDAVPPTPPTTVQAKTLAFGAVRLDWSGATDNVAVTGYRISRNGVEIGISATTQFVDFLPPPDTALSYTIAARDAAGNWSAVSAETPAVRWIERMLELEREAANDVPPAGLAPGHKELRSR